MLGVLSGNPGGGAGITLTPLPSCTITLLSGLLIKLNGIITQMLEKTSDPTGLKLLYETNASFTICNMSMFYHFIVHD